MEKGHLLEVWAPRPTVKARNAGGHMQVLDGRDGNGFFFNGLLRQGLCGLGGV